MSNVGVTPDKPEEKSYRNIITIASDYGFPVYENVSDLKFPDHPREADEYVVTQYIQRVGCVSKFD